MNSRLVIGGELDLEVAVTNNNVCKLISIGEPSPRSLAREDSSGGRVRPISIQDEGPLELVSSTGEVL